MTRKEKVDYIINNSFRFSEANRSFLDSLSEADLDGTMGLVKRDATAELRDEIALS